MADIDFSRPGLQPFTLPVSARNVLMKIASITGAKPENIIMYGSWVYGPLLQKQARDFDFMISALNVTNSFDKVKRSIHDHTVENMRFRHEEPVMYVEQGRQRWTKPLKPDDIRLDQQRRLMRIQDEYDDIDLVYVNGPLDLESASAFSNIALCSATASIEKLYLPADFLADRQQQTITMRESVSHEFVRPTIKKIHKLSSGELSNYRPVFPDRFMRDRVYRAYFDQRGMPRR